MVYGDLQALVENVSAMPGQSPNGMFSFGFACAAPCRRPIVAADIPLRLVTPQVWKKHYGLKGGRENKDQARQLACRLFPQHAELFARKKDDGGPRPCCSPTTGGFNDVHAAYRMHHFGTGENPRFRRACRRRQRPDPGDWLQAPPSVERKASRCSRGA
jgi:hypothetical protein